MKNLHRRKQSNSLHSRKKLRGKRSLAGFTKWNSKYIKWSPYILSSHVDSNVDSRTTFREYWVLIFGLMSSDSELFIVSNVCPGRSTPCWGWPGPPAPSSSRCPAGTRASSPGPASRGDTCSVTCHVSSGQPWSRFLRIPILTILTTLLLNPRTMVSKWKDTFYILCFIVILHKITPTIL